MFDIGFMELMIILAIAAVIIGPKNLPGLAKALGKGWGEFQTAFEKLKQDVMDETDTLRSSVDLDPLKKDVPAAKADTTAAPDNKDKPAPN
ncbi:MAG: twin-arginine translocase TatA/TatE family subunit [Nitrospinales bacterium]